MTSIYTNLNAMSAARNLRAAEHIVEKAVEQISTGKRINKPEDDPFMFSSAGRLESDLTMASVSKANINDGAFVMSLYANSLETIKEMLLEAKQITMRGASGSASDADRTELKSQLDAIAVQMAEVQDRTQFNGKSVFDKSGYTIAWSGTSVETQEIKLSNTKIELGANVSAAITQERDAKQISFNNAKNALVGAIVTAINTANPTNPPVNASNFNNLTDANLRTVATANSISFSAAGVGKNYADALTALNTAQAAYNTAADGSGFIKSTGTNPSVVITANLPLDSNNQYSSESFSNLMSSIQNLIGTVVQKIGTAGVDMFTLNSVKDFIDESSLATSNLLSSFTDSDFVEASTNLARGQVLSSAAAHMLQQSQQDLRRFVDQLLS